MYTDVDVPVYSLFICSNIANLYLTQIFSFKSFSLFFHSFHAFQILSYICVSKHHRKFPTFEFLASNQRLHVLMSAFCQAMQIFLYCAIIYRDGSRAKHSLVIFIWKELKLMSDNQTPLANLLQTWRRIFVFLFSSIHVPNSTFPLDYGVLESSTQKKLRFHRDVEIVE